MSQEKILVEEEIISSNLLESTDVTDIAQLDPKIRLSKPTISLSIPAMIGFTQTLDAPEGFVFGVTKRDRTTIINGPYPPTLISPSQPETPEDLVISRKLMKTEVREILVKTLLKKVMVVILLMKRKILM